MFKRSCCTAVLVEPIRRAISPGCGGSSNGRQSCANAESGYASHCGGSGFPHRTAEDEHMPEAPLVCVRNAWRDEGRDVFRGDYVQPKRGSNRLVRGTDWSDIGRPVG